MDSEDLPEDNTESDEDEGDTMNVNVDTPQLDDHREDPEAD